MRKLAIAGVSAVALLLTSVTQAQALPISQPTPIATQSTDNLVEIRHRDGRYGNWSKGGKSHWKKRRHHRRHYNDWDDDWWWGPAAGFGLGLVLGAAPRYYEVPVYRTAPRVGVNAAHIAWCERRYRSYRAWDNTFKPYHGPRIQCISPYI
jgi:hypothetical protein